MKSNPRNPPAGTAVAESVSPTTIFAALSNERRQHALQYLVLRPGDVVVGDLAEYVTIKDGLKTRDQYERILTGLVHTHLPHLNDAELVSYDADTETVSLLVDAEVLYPYLELAAPVDE